MPLERGCAAENAEPDRESELKARLSDRAARAGRERLLLASSSEEDLAIHTRARGAVVAPLVRQLSRAPRVGRGALREATRAERVEFGDRVRASRADEGVGAHGLLLDSGESAAAGARPPAVVDLDAAVAVDALSDSVG